MSWELPAHLRHLFAPRDPVEFAPFEEHKKHGAYSGVATYLSQFEDAESDRAAREAAALKPHIPTASELREAKRQRRIAANEARIAEQLEHWDPHAYTEEHDHVTRDPYHTIVLYRLVCFSLIPFFFMCILHVVCPCVQPYNVTEEDLTDAMNEIAGRVRTVRIVRNKKTGTPRGYAFVEFESSSAMRRLFIISLTFVNSIVLFQFMGMWL